MCKNSGAGSEHWDLLIHRCVSRTSDIASRRPPTKRYMADKTILDVLKLKAILDELRRLAHSEERQGVMKPRVRRKTLCKLVCLPSPWCFFCCSRWCIDTENNWEEYPGCRSLRRNVRSNAWTEFLFEPFSITIASVDSDVAGKTVGGNNTQLLAWQWPGDDDLILRIVTSIVDTTIGLIMKASIADLKDPCRTFPQLRGCQEPPNGGCGLHMSNVTPILDNHNAAGRVWVAMKLNNTTHFYICIMDNKLTAQVVPRRQCMVATASSLWMRSCHPQRGIWSWVSWRNQTIML